MHVFINVSHVRSGYRIHNQLLVKQVGAQFLYQNFEMQRLIVQLVIPLSITFVLLFKFLFHLCEVR